MLNTRLWLIEDYNFHPTFAHTTVQTNFHCESSISTTSTVFILVRRIWIQRNKGQKKIKECWKEKSVLNYILLYKHAVKGQ